MSDMSSVTNEDRIPRVYGCATMWHESSEEIIEMLKSIFRIDEDYSARYGNLEMSLLPTAPSFAEFA